jgi:hypothetical protein
MISTPPQHAIKKQYPSRLQLIQGCHMKPKDTIYFRVNILALNDAILFLLNNERYVLFDEMDRNNLSMVDKKYHELVHMCS